MTLKKPWTPEDERVLRESYSILTVREIAQLLGRSSRGCHRKAGLMGLRKMDRTDWSSEEIEMLKTHFATTPRKELAHLMGRTAKSVEFKARHLRLFSAGYEDWLPSPIGTEKVSRGQLVRKIVNEHGKPAWKRVDVITWEAANGPLPAGMMVVAKKRMAPRDAANLGIVPLAKNGLFAALQAMPPEIKELHQLKAQLGWRLKHIEKRNAATRK